MDSHWNKQSLLYKTHQNRNKYFGFLNKLSFTTCLDFKLSATTIIYIISITPHLYYTPSNAIFTIRFYEGIENDYSPPAFHFLIKHLFPLMFLVLYLFLNVSKSSLFQFFGYSYIYAQLYIWLEIVIKFLYNFELNTRFYTPYCKCMAQEMAGKIGITICVSINA